MSDTAATIFTAIASGIFALAGAGIGYRAGRRQTTDQATVEHGQWLRGQRQEAYVQLLDAWESAVKELQAFQSSWHDRVEYFRTTNSEIHPSVTAGEKTREVWAVLRPRIEQAELLGLPGSEGAVAGLYDAWRDLAAHFDGQAEHEPFSTEWGSWQRVLTGAVAARQNFQGAASRVLRTPPRPQGELLL